MSLPNQMTTCKVFTTDVFQRHFSEQSFYRIRIDNCVKLSFSPYFNWNLGLSYVTLPIPTNFNKFKEQQQQHVYILSLSLPPSLSLSLPLSLSLSLDLNITPTLTWNVCLDCTNKFPMTTQIHDYAYRSTK